MHTTETQSTFTSWDGTELFYRAWQPSQPCGKAVIVLHRGHEHSGRVAGLFDALDLQGVQGFSYDMRGHGRSPGERGYADRYDTWIKDLNAFINHVRDQHHIVPEDMALLANSVGAVNAVTWLHDYGVPIRCIVLAAPAFRIRLYVPFAIPLLRLLLAVRPRAFIKSYVRGGMLSHDQAEVAAYDADPLITRTIAVSVLVGMHDAATRILADAGAITTPTLILSAGRDYVVENRAQADFHRAISSTRKEFITYPDSFHAVLYEANRRDVLARVSAFIQSCFAGDTPRAPTTADASGYTRREYDALRSRAALPRNVLFGLQVTAMRSAGRLSRGIDIGCRTGFNSGASLDHVYRDQAEGRGFLGRLIDRGYLDAIGWRGIRIRKGHLMHWLRQAAARLTAENRPVRIMDVAAGPGRYLLEFKREALADIAVLLRDREQANLDAARTLASAWNLDNVHTEAADAFDPQSYRNLAFAPNVAVVSGLYELFPDNTAVRTSLKGIADSLEPGGYLIYTGQPWHPQLEMIARTLTGSDGQPWIMRRRTQEELNALVAEAGFTRVDSLIDSFGIFTVTLARKEH